MSTSPFVKRISLWSGPRNISTALMYAFAQRKDTKVYDEPLYGYYLSHSPAKAYHPGAEEVIQTMENDGGKVVEMMLQNTEKPVLFFKNMTHHLLDLDRSFMKGLVNIILTRDPVEMLPSFAEVIDAPSMDDVGYKMHIDLLGNLEAMGLPVIVINSKSILENPEHQLKKLCEAIEIPFDKNMLQWETGPRPEDGCWAKYWYGNIHRSTGFMPYKPKTVPFPEKLKPLLNECLPYYRQLMEKAL
ncbi:sulfotransferase family protein [Negadavirga shengliensis]|uniref:Sulfotransferase family protein n=1 Tax=Negadavirga shengliensis TaxID=1389218 RepID=A0ABV9SWG6_9BACT